ncbi:unnamed protein product [Rotaria sp. Silwood2]|nr:unnamed protein product [Rotaria sp. Silwood2]
MASRSPDKSLFDEIDTNQDEKIDRDEFRKWASRPVEVSSSQYERLNTDLNQSHTVTSRLDRYEHKDINLSAFESTANQYSLYGTTTIAKDYSSDTAIVTRSVSETELYLENHGIDLCKNPEIIRRTIPERPSTYEQRVLVRYLQPPALPPAGPLIIKEVRAEQPPPPPPLIIREQAPPLSSPPPLILRERPPTPPPILPSETITRMLPPLPTPQRSVVIERYPPLPEKPRDIIIERWIPYGRQIERRTIVQPAPPAREYPRASCTVVIYEGPQARIVRKFEQLDVTIENPEDYVARYRGSLLDSTTLVQEARNIGIIEDITPSVLSLSVNAKMHGANDRLQAIAAQYEINNTLAQRLNILQQFEIVVLCDDSGSMNTPVDGTTRTRWDELRSIVQIVIEIATVFNSNGVDLHFLNRSSIPNVTDSRQVVESFSQRPDGVTPLTQALRRIFQAAASKPRSDKRLLVFVATDGEPTDSNGNVEIQGLENLMRNERQANTTYVTFLSCTDDESSVAYLSQWDRTMMNVDVVDDYKTEREQVRRTRGYNYPFSFGDYVAKALLGAVDRQMDLLDESGGK